ncbi:response regulator transcription factor [Kribbella catacumbae]|uniref:response regulator transcription factor n=1 Tax=Kribbella catacumbae TaxID=460086 RepID=UPI00037D4159|nr:response regulator transcription factor [Kribbella catacumbae]
MTSSVVNAWESDSSQFHARRRASLSGTEKVHHRVVVLLVDNGEEVAQFVKAIEGQPVELHVCAEPAEALLQVGRLSPDVVILGPGGGLLDPIDFLTVIRADDPQLPVVVGAGADCPDFTVRAHNAGASAVIPRPFRVRELLALVNSLSPTAHQVELRPLAIDLGRLRVDGAVPQMWLDGRQVELPPMEFLLLRFFAERVGALLTRQEVLDGVWGQGASVRSNTLNVHVMRLRKRLGDDDQNPRWIRAVRGLGLQFSVPEPESVTGGGAAPSVGEEFAG